MGQDSRVTRRRALSMAAAGTGGLLLSSAIPAWARRAATTPAPFLRPHHARIDALPDATREMGEPGIPQIEHVVCVMMENHSLDNVLGMLPMVSAAHRWTFDGLPFDNSGHPIASNPNTTGPAVFSYKLPDDCPFQGLSQDWDNSHYQYNNGANNGFVVTTKSPTSMGYFAQDTFPVTYAIASNYPISDRHFCSLLGQTLPNRRFYFSGTSSGYVNDDDQSLLVDAANGTIFDRLSAANTSFKVYTDGTPTPYYFPSFRDKYAADCPGLAAFITSAANGTLPTVSYVEANGDYESEENPQDVAYGENFVWSVVNACQKSPLWPKMALFITYDEHGGYYDHVPPPSAPAPDGIQPILGLSKVGTYKAGFDRYGFRVPFMVVSPWAQPDAYVSHKVTDHTSVLAFLEHWLNLPPMTQRDAQAWNLSDMFDVTAPSFPDGIALPSGPSIPDTLAKCRADGESPPTAPST